MLYAANNALEHILFVFDVLDSELDIGQATVVILGNGIADVYGVASLDVCEMVRLIECNRRHRHVCTLFLNELQFQVAVVGTDAATVAVVVNIFRIKI